MTRRGPSIFARAKPPSQGPKSAVNPFSRARPAANPFARARPAPLSLRPVRAGGISDAEIKRLQVWAASIPAPDYIDPDKLATLRSADLLSDLERLGALSASDLAKLRRVDPRRMYVLTMTVLHYVTVDASADAPPGYSGESRTVVFMGRGSALVRKVHYFAAIYSDIQHLSIRAVDEARLDPVSKDIRPLFDGDEISLLGGRQTALGVGTRFERAKRPGPKRKYTTQSKRKFLDRERKKKVRERERKEKEKSIFETLGAAARATFLRRSHAARRGADNKGRAKPRPGKTSRIWSRVIPQKPKDK